MLFLIKHGCENLLSRTPLRKKNTSIFKINFCEHSIYIDLYHILEENRLKKLNLHLIKIVKSKAI